MKRFKTHEQTFEGVTYYVKYLGALVEGNLKWYTWSNSVDFGSVEQLCATKSEANESAKEAIKQQKAN